MFLRIKHTWKQFTEIYLSTAFAPPFLFKIIAQTFEKADQTTDCPNISPRKHKQKM